MSYLSLVSYTTQTWSKTSGTRFPGTNLESRRKWLNDLTALVDGIKITSQHTTSTLSLLSASVSSGTALPAHMMAPEPYDLDRELSAIDDGILAAKHLEEPGYSAYCI
jgi:hypothetical protein